MGDDGLLGIPSRVTQLCGYYEAMQIGFICHFLTHDVAACDPAESAHAVCSIEKRGITNLKLPGNLRLEFALYSRYLKKRRSADFL